MAAFSLSDATGSFDFSLDGTVTKAGAPAGAWTTNETNQLVVTDTNGVQTPLDVSWMFNADNQLCLLSKGSQVYDFHQGDQDSPFYSVSDKAVLEVYPSQSGTFFFNLHGNWALTPSHDLSLTLGGQTSIIDGYVEDQQSRFIYYFFDKQLPFSFNLNFTGTWSSAVDPSDGVLKMNFEYAREDGSPATLSLPEGVTIDRTINQFVYQYDKDDHTRRITFMGMLNVTQDFQIKYAIDRQTSDSGQEQVGATTLTIDAIFKNDSFSGDLEFLVKKADGAAGTTTLGIKGNFTAALGDTKLMVGYGFTMTRGQQPVNWSLFFNGSLALKDNGQIQWEFQANAQSFSISIAAQDIQIGKARIDARLNLTGQGGQVGIYAMFGIAF